MTILMSNCVSCAKAEQSHGSMAGKAAERQHWFNFNISLALFSALSFRTEMSPEERSEKCDASHSARPDQMASCLFTLFLPFFFFLPPKVLLLSSAGSPWQHRGWSHDRWQEPRRPQSNTQRHNASHIRACDVTTFFLCCLHGPGILRLPAHWAPDWKIFRRYFESKPLTTQLTGQIPHVFGQSCPIFWDIDPWPPEVTYFYLF